MKDEIIIIVGARYTRGQIQINADPPKWSCQVHITETASIP